MGVRRLRSSAWLAAQIVAGTLLVPAQTAITTYHYDNNRTGWNQNEAVLTPANVNAKSFGLLQTVALDAQVDGQPLVVPGVLITTGNYQGKHDVVYVATEGNTIYAVDAETGTVLLSPNFGTPVTPPSVCGPSPRLGIHSTPVIDSSSNTMYVVIYSNDSTGPAYRIHALDLGSLTDKLTPQFVAASHTLTDGSTFAFNAIYQRQRPALLLANGNLYASFGSFCDAQANFSRGWLLGWSTASLTPLPPNQLVDTQSASPDSYFLSSIWMSGYGPAADDSGNILFVTGNSQYSTYDGITNIQESVVKVSSTLNATLDLFTPSNQDSLDLDDVDFGSGGVMLLPDQPGSTPHLAVAAGKAGVMFLMNEDNLGGYSTKNKVLGSYSIGPCWCGESYFVDPRDGAARVVSSGGRSVKVWKLHTSSTPSLSGVSSSAAIAGGKDSGFFTSVSSNGKANPVIWALSRPVFGFGSNAAIYLYAFNPELSGATLKQIFRAAAGAWPNPGNNSNQVPVVANGEVFVASSRQLQIFGLKAAGSKKK
jgi:outer membrane protein assembly factor BamB